MKRDQLIIGITGASGAPYARALLNFLGGCDVDVHLVASSAGKLVYELETGETLDRNIPKNAKLYDVGDFTAPFASGSFRSEGMVIVPCTMATLSAVANGMGQNLVHRAADVCIKERRPLILVPRETPLSRIHLTNMLRASEAGAIILPAMPGFYQKPQSAEDLVTFIVARILDQLRLPHALLSPWDPNRAWPDRKRP